MKEKLLEAVNAGLAAMACLPHALNQGLWNALNDARGIILALPDDLPPAELARHRERVRSLLLAVGQKHREQRRMVHPKSGPRAGRECSISGILPALGKLMKIAKNRLVTNSEHVPNLPVH